MLNHLPDSGHMLILSQEDYASRHTNHATSQETASRLARLASLPYQTLLQSCHRQRNQQNALTCTSKASIALLKPHCLFQGHSAYHQSDTSLVVGTDEQGRASSIARILVG